MSILQEKRFVFIIGSPRSGTSWLQTMLASHPKVVSTVETTMYSAYLSPLLKAYQAEKDNINKGRWTKGLPHLINESDFHSFLIGLLDKAYDTILAQKPEADYVLDKAPENTFFIDTICHFIPKAKLIHIIRDGRDVVCSMRNVKRKVGHQTENITKGAALWKRSVETARSFGATSDNYIEINYEDLLSNGESELNRVFEFCDINITDSDCTDLIETFSFKNMRKHRPTPDPNVKANRGHYHKGKPGTWTEELSEKDLMDFCEVAGNLLVGLGYADTKWIFNHRISEISRRSVPSWIKARLYYLSSAFLGAKSNFS
jgi:hypothetical protein